MEVDKQKEKEARGAEPAGAGAQRGPKGLTQRDRQMLAVLATARYLSSEQICRLFFPTRLKRTGEQLLEALAGVGRFAVGRPLVRSLEFRALNCALVIAWTLTPAGYVLAEEVLGTPQKAPDKDIGLEFLEHTLQLNELLTALLEPGAPKRPMPRRGRNAAQVFARADFRAFRWTSSEGARLPWREYDRKAGQRRERVILPDAVLELVSPRRRLFLECEMGTQTVVPQGPDKPGSTIAKVERYHQYMRRLADPERRLSFYDAQYPDGFAAEVVFLVRSAVRAVHVNEALGLWRKTCTEEPIAARAVTFPEAAKEVRGAVGLGLEPRAAEPASQPAGAGRLGQPPQESSARALHQKEAAILSRFVFEAMRALQGARHQVRAVPEPVRKAHRLNEPNYPTDSEAAQALASELASALALVPKTGSPSSRHKQEQG